jgi:RNA polymerase primary sigma factor
MQRIDRVDEGDIKTATMTDLRDLRTSNLRAVAAGGTVRSYLHDIGRVPLLSAELEAQCAKQIELGREAATRREDWKRDGVLGHIGRTERRLVEQCIHDGEEARLLLIEANLRLVVSIAKRYHHRSMALPDLIQEGNLGLMKAVDRFDYRKGFRFSTYATWWIRQAITRAMSNQARTIRVPSYLVESFNNLVQVRRQLVQDLGGEPSIEQLAARADLPVERVREIQRISQDTISLEQPIGDRDNFILSDVIEDHQAEEAADVATRMFLREAIGHALCELSDREREVLQLRFGLEDGRARTLEEVGKIFGVTSARMGHIETRALAKLRQMTQSTSLREYLETSVSNV